MRVETDIKPRVRVPVDRVDDHSVGDQFEGSGTLGLTVRNIKYKSFRPDITFPTFNLHDHPTLATTPQKEHNHTGPVSFVRRRLLSLCTHTHTPHYPPSFPCLDLIPNYLRPGEQGRGDNEKNRDPRN